MVLLFHGRGGIFRFFSYLCVRAGRSDMRDCCPNFLSSPASCLGAAARLRPRTVSESRCVHLPRHSEPGFRRFVPAPVCFAGPRRAGRCGCRLRRFLIWRTFRSSGAHPCVVRWPRMPAGPSDSAAACAAMPGPGGVRGDGFRGGGVFAARFFGCRELPAFLA